MKAAFETSANYKNFRNIEADFFSTSDSQGRAIYSGTFENCLALILTNESAEFAANILTALRNAYAKIN